MPISCTITLNNPALETQVKAVLEAEGFDPGADDTTASAALKRLVQRELRHLFLDRLRERVAKDAGEQALATLRTRIETQI